MNIDQISGKWDQIKGRLQEAWGDLTDTDMSSLGDNLKDASSYLQSKYNLTEDAVHETLNKHFGSNENSEYSSEDHNDEHNQSHRAM